MPADEIDLELPDLRDRLRAFALERRDFLKLCGGGLLVLLGGAAGAQESGRGGGAHHALPQEISAWIHIDAHGRVTVYTGKVEVGQNIRTSLAQSVAEELHAPFDSVVMVMGDTDLVPWDAGTFGSRTTPTMGPQLRNMAAAARQLLLEAAAQRWGANPEELIAEDGHVRNPGSGATLSYAAITRGEKLTRTVSGDPPLTPASAWTVAGTAIPRVDGRKFVTGEHAYPSDIGRPGMLFGKVLRPSGFRATLISANADAAAGIPGVRVVRDGDFIGVVAEDLWSAEQALRRIEARWSVPAQPSNDQWFEEMRRSAASQQPAAAVEQAIAAADVRLAQTYTVDYIAHAPLEPRAAVAEWNNGKLTVWTGTQRPFGVRDELARTFHLTESQVRVLMPDMGSGYGGKHTGECAVEAARLAKAAGAPVKLVWTREEEFTWAYFRPSGLMTLRAGAKHDGTLVAWEHHNYNSGPPGIETPYSVAAKVEQFHEMASPPLAQGSYRGLASTANHFARETHMDELAHELGMDPLEFRLKNLDNPRLKAVFEAAADRFGWKSAKSSPGGGYGIAGGTDKGGYVAACAEVEIGPNRKIRIRRVVQAWESGAIVNPDGLENQIAGALAQAIGGALFERVRYADGRVLNGTFTEYRVPRFSDMPKIEIVLVNRKDLPSAGAGEIGIVALAPAVGNAIFAAAGKRLRAMPMEQDLS